MLEACFGSLSVEATHHQSSDRSDPFILRCTTSSEVRLHEKHRRSRLTTRFPFLNFLHPCEPLLTKATTIQNHTPESGSRQLLSLTLLSGWLNRLTLLRALLRRTQSVAWRAKAATGHLLHVSSQESHPLFSPSDNPIQPSKRSEAIKCTCIQRGSTDSGTSESHTDKHPSHSSQQAF